VGIKTSSVAQLSAMDKASGVFDTVLTPILISHIRRTAPNLQQAWWDGFLSSVVGAMTATIGEKATQECCEDLYTRAKDFAADRAKQSTADIPKGL
jgi:hypothetical protein